MIRRRRALLARAASPRRPRQRGLRSASVIARTRSRPVERLGAAPRGATPRPLANRRGLAAHAARWVGFSPAPGELARRAR
jgi:hypothetical protein